MQKTYVMDTQTYTNTSSIRMKDDPELYRHNNHLTKKDTIDCLEEYASKLTWRLSGETIFEIGPADGSITKILVEYLPKNYDRLLSYDISDKMVKYANVHHADDRTEFAVLDVEGHLPDELMEKFDHGFSFSTFHWITNQEKGFANLYSLLKPGGECLVTFFGSLPTYSLFLALSRTKKWGQWLTDVHKMVSPYHDCHDPEAKIVQILKKIGFYEIDVRCKQRVFVYDSTEALKRVLAAINPFDIPKGMLEDFLDELANVARNMGIVDDRADTVKYIYNLFIVHCKK